MASTSKIGPIVLPWDDNRPSEVAAFLIAGLVGAVVGTTILYHYRQHRP